MKLDMLDHDNAHPYAAVATMEAMQQLLFGSLVHLSYNPDLRPCDCHVLYRVSLWSRVHLWW